MTESRGVIRQLKDNSPLQLKPAYPLPSTLPATQSPCDTPFCRPEVTSPQPAGQVRGYTLPRGWTPVNGPTAANRVRHSFCLNAITMPDHRSDAPGARLGGVHCCGFKNKAKCLLHGRFRRTRCPVGRGLDRLGIRWIGSNGAAGLKKGECNRLETVENPLGAIFTSWTPGAPEAAGCHVSPYGISTSCG
jgi:hypothetical protein